MPPAEDVERVCVRIAELDAGAIADGAARRLGDRPGDDAAALRLYFAIEERDSQGLIRPEAGRQDHLRAGDGEIDHLTPLAIDNRRYLAFGREPRCAPCPASNERQR